MRTPLLILLLLEGGSVPLLTSEFEFVVVGDTRPRFESESFRPFESLIEKINAAQPALVINLGDLIYGYGPVSKNKQWDNYAAVIKTIHAPYYQVPGNHDTHSREARRIYGRRFGEFYQSFDYGSCHFVLLDNTEQGRWGYLGPNQLTWLKNDLKAQGAHAVFVFLHFPVWEPDRITPQYYEFWAKTLHPLFKASRVRAVFGGHYHAYGPTREFDGIRYFITGGGGAELRPEYKKAGGEYHFMKVKVSDGAFDVRVCTGQAELADPEADVMGGLQFAARNVSRIGIPRDGQDLRAGVIFSVGVQNPYAELLSGQAEWVMDASAFSVNPEKVSLKIPAGATGRYTFTLKVLQQSATLQSLPRLEFNAVSGGRRHRFHREVRLLQRTVTPFQASPLVVDGQVSDWRGMPALNLGPMPNTQLRTCHDRQNLYIALTIPAFDPAEAKELGFADDLQIGFARRVSTTDFDADLLRVGVNSETEEVWDRTPGRKSDRPIPGVKSACRNDDQSRTYEIALPLRVLGEQTTRSAASLILDLSFPTSDSVRRTEEPAEPGPNTFSYRVRYGADSLGTVYFVELTLMPKQ